MLPQSEVFLPFNPSTRIDYEIAEPGQVKIAVYNLLGQVVATLVDDHREAGSYSLVWDASSLASGVYVYKLEAEEGIQVRKMLLAR